MSIFLITLLFPLCSFLIISGFGRYLGVYGSMVFSVMNIWLSFFISIFLFIFISFDSALYVQLWNWTDVSGMCIGFDFRYDSLTAIMFLVVTLVSSCVHTYSCVYMYTDPFLTRFLSYLSFFTFFMLILVSSANLLVLFLGWEGVGLCSYLLIGFWYTRAQAGKAATKAFLVNKIGDLFLLTSICIVVVTAHSIDFASMSALAPYFPTSVLEIIAGFALIGVVGKSAQVGLHTWLPDAMEGPTPVSALIHAATMVTAGVFLLLRLAPVIEFAPRVSLLICLWGGVTAFVSGTIGAAQNDIKKIIAYSTCSQLGYMVMSCGLSAYNSALFHLFNHAFFKALLFLSAGSIIHIMIGEQDIRRMGALSKITPYVYMNILVASLALAGTPFLAGFYSKDFIIEIANTKFLAASQCVYWLSVVSALLTAIYSFRLLEQVFWANYSGYKNILLKRAKVTVLELCVLGVLCCLTLISGYLFKDIFTGFGSNYFNNTTLLLTATHGSVEIEFLPFEIKVLPLVLSICAFELENKLFECKWFYNEVINNYLSLPTLFLSRHLFEQHEKITLEQNGPALFVYIIGRFNKTL